MTTTAMARGASGAVIDGFHRDTRLLASMDFAVFSRGPFGQDARVRTIVAGYGVPIDVERVQIAPGDLVVGDLDGVVVVPKAVEQEVLERALVKVESEDVVRAAIADGMTSTVAFATYGVL